MATAKRVPQDQKVEGGFTQEVHEAFGVTVVNGKETSRVKLAEELSVIDNRRFIPQADRISLDLSIEEATVIQAIVFCACCGSGEGRQLTDRINVALNATGIQAPRTPFRKLDGTTQTIQFTGPFVVPEGNRVSPASGTKASSGAVSGRNTGSLLRPAVDVKGLMDPQAGTTSGSSAIDQKALHAARMKEAVVREMRRAGFIDGYRG